MTCPNCGLENPPGARFCGNCGTSFTGGPMPPPPPPPNAYYDPTGSSYNQSSQPYNMTSGWNSGGQRMSFGRAIGMGCLLVVVLFFLFFFSCTRACLRPRSYYRYMQYSHAIIVDPQQCT